MEWKGQGYYKLKTLTQTSLDTCYMRYIARPVTPVYSCILLSTSVCELYIWQPLGCMARDCFFILFFQFLLVSHGFSFAVADGPMR